MGPVRRVGFCPHCCNRAPQTLIHDQGYEAKGYGVADASEDLIPSAYYVVSCDTCSEILVYSDFGGVVGAEHFEESELVWPKKKTLSNAVPKDIIRVYEEAASIQWVSPDAFAVQIRRGLEAICTDRGVKERNLLKALEVLSDRGEIPPVLSEMSDVLRLLGNLGAHWTGQHVHPLQTPALDEFFRAVVEYIYVAPSRLSQFRDQLAEFEKYHPQGITINEKKDKE